MGGPVVLEVVVRGILHTTPEPRHKHLRLVLQDMVVLVDQEHQVQSRIAAAAVVVQPVLVVLRSGLVLVLVALVMTLLVISELLVEQVVSLPEAEAEVWIIVVAVEPEVQAAAEQVVQIIRMALLLQQIPDQVVAEVQEVILVVVALVGLSLLDIQIKVSFLTTI
jgi:hypothetical protein